MVVFKNMMEGIVHFSMLLLLLLLHAVIDPETPFFYKQKQLTRDAKPCV